MRRHAATAAAAVLVAGSAGAVVSSRGDVRADAPAVAAAAAGVAPVVEDRTLARAAGRASRDSQRRRLRRSEVRRAELLRHHLARAARRRHRRELAAARTRLASNGGVPAVWMALARCESGGDWQDTAGGFEGGVQFLASTWLAYGGGRYAAHAYDATPAEQVAVARRLLDADGPGQWPVCGPQVGLARGD